MTKMTDHKLPFIAIVGKPNVGKSSLFNRLIGKKMAITSEEAGTTRDRVFHRLRVKNFDSILVDTGGLEFEEKHNLEADTQTQARIAINEADLIVYLIDGQSIPTSDDLEAANILRRQSKKIIFVANKVDHENISTNLTNWLELGFGQPIAVSVIHNKGIARLFDTLENELKNLGYNENEQDNITSTSIKISLIGRPNAGKSSLVNAIIGQNRVIVSDTPGTTRDAVDIELTIDNSNYTLIDTAGLRRRGRIEKGLEKFSSFRTIDAIERSDIVCLVLDYSVGIRAQDLHICSYILEANKGLILLVNKTDLMEDKIEEKDRIGRILKNRFDFLSWAPVLFVSAKNRKNLELIFETVKSIYFERNKKIDQQAMIDFIKVIYRKHQAPTHARQKLLFFDIHQANSATPTFIITVNNPDTAHFSYRRFIENEFRNEFGFNGTAINFIYKSLDPKLLKKSEPL